jgi:hypothetical protein
VKSTPTHFLAVLDSEFKRVALIENKTMEELTEEIAQLLGRTRGGARQIYNWRSGKWSPAARFIPILCRRFKSLALANALLADCSDVKVDVPDAFDLVDLTSKTVRADLSHYERFLRAYESNGIQRHELVALRESSDQVINNVEMLYGIAVADCERREAARADVPHHYVGVRQHHER